MTFLCSYCDSITSGNDLICYRRRYVDALTGSYKFARACYICPNCYYMKTGKYYDFEYYKSSEFSEKFDSQVNCYIEYVKKRVDIINGDSRMIIKKL